MLDTSLSKLTYFAVLGLLTVSSSAWPQTSLFEIAASGVPADKLVIGKPASPSDASNGYVDPATLATCFAQAKEKGWKAGGMVWQFSAIATSWIATIRGSAFPMHELKQY